MVLWSSPAAQEWPPAASGPGLSPDMFEGSPRRATLPHPWATCAGAQSPHSEKVFPDIQRERPCFSCVLVAFGPALGTQKILYKVLENIVYRQNLKTGNLGYYSSDENDNCFCRKSVDPSLVTLNTVKLFFVLPKKPLSD